MKKTQGKPVQTQIILKQNTHPEGGYGWVVVFSAFSVQFIAVGLQNSSGTIFYALIDEFKRSKGETAWVGSLGIGVMFLCGPLTTSLCEKYGCRVVACTGAFLCVFGLIMSSFARTLEVMYVTYGVTWGLGASFCYFPTLIILVEYFDKRLALVNGIVSSGSGLGTLVISPFCQFILSHVGLFNSMRILALINALSFICGLTMRPVDEKYSQLQRRVCPQNMSNGGKERNESLSIWREKSYIAWTVAISTFMLGYFVPFVHLRRHAALIGVSDSRASFLIGILSITSTIGKVFAGKIADSKRVNILYMYQIGLLTMSISTTLVPVGRGYAELVAYALIFGLAEACFVVLIPLVTKYIVGVERLSPALGSLFMIMALPTMLGPPVAGWIYDLSGSYSVAFYVAGGFMAAGVCLIFLIPFCSENATEKEDRGPVLITCEESTSEDNSIKNEKQINGNAVVEKVPDVLHGSNDHIEAQFLPRKSRSCIMTCLPSRGHSWVEEGTYHKEEVINGNALITEKVSVI